MAGGAEQDDHLSLGDGEVNLREGANAPGVGDRDAAHQHDREAGHFGGIIAWGWK